MIRFKGLWWDNCFSYGPGNYLELDKNTITQIVGLNGAGKSSIPLIIEEAAFNKNSKGYKKVKIANRYLPGGYKIKLVWDKDDDEYAVYVDRKSSLKVKLEKNGEDVSSHTALNTYKSIQEILGVDFKTFSQLVYQHPDSSLEFLKATDTNRKKFLIDLLGLEEYIELFDTFKLAAKELSIEVVEIEAKIATIEKWLSSNKLSDTTLQPMLNLEIDTEEDEKEARKLSIEISNISEINKKISKNNQYKKLLKEIDLTKINEVKDLSLKDLAPLQSQLGGWQSSMKSSKTLFSKISRLGSVCPTCTQKISDNMKQNLLNNEISFQKETQDRIDAVEKEIADLMRVNVKINNAAKLQRQWEDIYRNIDPKETRTILYNEEDLRNKLSKVTKRINQVREEASSIALENELRTKANTRIQVILEQTEEFQSELAEASELLNARAGLLHSLDILRKAFSTNGLLAYKIENLVKELEDLTNKYLAELSDGRFTLGFVVLNDKLNVELTDDGDIVDITELSSGELARVNTATLIAIRKLMSSISKARINILFLDEVINVLDSDGKEKLIEILLKEKELNTYIVSHQWTHPLLDKIDIEKVDKISKLEV